MQYTANIPYLPVFYDLWKAIIYLVLSPNIPDVFIILDLDNDDIDLEMNATDLTLNVFDQGGVEYISQDSLQVIILCLSVCPSVCFLVCPSSTT